VLRLNSRRIIETPNVMQAANDLKIYLGLGHAGLQHR
jgi:hypothetical protein